MDFDDQKTGKIVSTLKITLDPLEYAIPIHASPNKEEWTSQQAQEVQRRQIEKEKIDGQDEKISKQMTILNKLQNDRNAEVSLINRRRQQHDNKIEAQKERKRISREIKKRKRQEEDEKEEASEIKKRRKMK